MTKYIVKPTSRFKKEYKLLLKQNKDISKLDKVIAMLAMGEELESKYKDHILIGTFQGFRECHIEPDWVLVYRLNEEELILSLSRTGSHSKVLKL